jgi:hypothetical protein
MSATIISSSQTAPHPEPAEGFHPVARMIAITRGKIWDQEGGGRKELSLFSENLISVCN